MRRAAEALGAGDYDGALGALLAEWDATRAPELAALIDEVSARVTAQLPALAILPQRDALTAWVELARQKRPSDVGRLLAALVAVLAAGPPRLPLPRLDELLALPPDPRIAAALLDALAGRLSGWSDKAYVRTVKALLLHGDARLIERLGVALAARAADYLDDADRARFEKVEAAWRKRAALPPPPGLAELRAALAAAPAPVAAAPKTQLDGDALLAAIYADPADDGRRLIYADYLSERGDARGELIVLQLDRAHGRTSPAADKREKALLKAHRSAWLGPLAAEIVIGETEWARGFPVATETKLAKLYQAEASFIRPEWATFERIRFGGASLITDAMRALTEAHGVSETAVKRLTKLASPPRLHTVGLAIDYAAGPAVDLAAVQSVLALPSLRALELRFGQWHDAQAEDVTRLCAAAGQRLERLSIGMGHGRLVAPFLDGAGGSDGGTLRALSWGFGLGFIATARRDDGGRWRTLEIRRDPSFPRLERAFEYLEKMLDGLADHSFELARCLDVDAAARPGGDIVQRLVGRVAARVELAAAP